MKLGSLFDGSGGFPLAGALSGITPIWASEIEMYPIAVTRSRFPDMEHLGNVIDIRGDKIQPVDVITFGSPCQDLSVAGKRAGIHDGQRSNLFFEAIRIIKEMREFTNGEYPKFAVWENVPGAFSSNGGEDFKCVLEAFVSVCEQGVSIPKPTKWGGAGEIVGNGYSVAWRTLDAQCWGVPQRRKRIYLVADFAGERAGKILFERESVQGHIEARGEARQGTAQDAEGSAGRSNSLKCLNPWDCQSKRIFEPDGIYPTLPAMDCGGANNQTVLYALDSMSSNSMKSSNPHSGFHAEKITKTLQADGADPTCNQGGNVIVEPVYALQGNSIDRADTAGCNGKGWREDVCYTLNTIDRPAICFKAGQGAKTRSLGASEKVAPTLGSEAGGNSIPAVCYPKVFHSLTATNARNVESAQQPNCVCYPQIARTLTAEADASLCINRGQNVVCVQNTGYGWWNQENIAETLRTPAEGDSTKANLVIACYDARGNGDGTHSPTLTGDHENRVTDYAALCILCIGHGEPNSIAMSERANTLTCMHDQQAIMMGGKPPRKYIIRRLMPLECCRLQGFPDGWGVPDHKDRLSDEELAFWQGVRDTYAKINDKPVRRYKADAMVKWYNGLHTDSAEYKMWGNGIALPCAAFVLRGIAECE